MSHLDTHTHTSTDRPHGGPIAGPRPARTPEAAVPLAGAAGLVEVLRIDEELHGDVDVMQFLDTCGVIPGRWAEVLRASRVGVHVVGARANAIVPAEVAEHTWVRAVDPARD